MSECAAIQMAYIIHRISIYLSILRFSLGNHRLNEANAFRRVPLPFLRISNCHAEDKIIIKMQAKVSENGCNLSILANGSDADKRAAYFENVHSDANAPNKLECQLGSVDSHIAHGTSVPTTDRPSRTQNRVRRTFHPCALRFSSPFTQHSH